MLDATESTPTFALTVPGSQAPLVLPTDPSELLPTLTAEVVYAPGNPMVIIGAVERWARAEAAKADAGTTKGRAALVSLAAKIASTKTGLDKLGLDMTAGWRERTKVVNTDRTRITSAFDTLKADIRQPVTEWERAEEERKQGHQDAIAAIYALGQFDMAEPTTAEIAARIPQAEDVGTRDWEEFAEPAAKARADTVDKLQALHTAAVQREAERAELARLRAEAERRRLEDEARARAEADAKAAKERAEREARIAQEAAERAAREAAAKAEAERLAAERRAAAEREAIEQQKREAEEAAARAEAARREAEVRAERERQEAAARAERERQEAIEAERRRVAAEEAARKAEEERRAADKRHRGRINRAVLQALLGLPIGLTEDQAKTIVEAIARSAIPHVSIGY
ncbi:conserved protein of unknown function (plasmid) [Rhodovastum atsumiense]|uniref:Uncharacterized protein n=1 Tax=Rhodovastum atsumiense TaxID=504468 RepID=A0A5M6IN53_9PROT|nr:hypothetical protein [Rhodovastum atsumiense]KAA5609696.1 hypothetical protein F1189_23335 [Rhodovastum atsumiense]CAH2606478.1 conserved protein of unknown function [Rhodovastum atsumiense]